ncbi:tyrosine recombinase XerC [Paraliobacillus ryukyuensis]|uniref:Phage integrase family protein n=1 Tax=Paraliobacillus ryukyuensis TaxID=200904 RepID=A0A366DZ52_9BACI|nr:site-specific integrase [Paraliobacillus ryukyuensis]RBO95380.1 phage integrase family protein [Paraliobacillus ryukyuensis]
MKIISESPVDSVDKPKFRNKDIDVYTIEEVRKLLFHLEKAPIHWNIIIKIAITMGLRRSELLGLEFKHFDFDNQLLYVRQAVTYSKTEGLQVHEIKKGNQNHNARKIVVSESLIEPIKKLQEIRQAEKDISPNYWNDDHMFLLCDINGKPYNPSTIKNWWKRFLDRNGLRYIHLHALRHTSATLLINESVHAKIISERLGHSDIRTTMNVYAHVLRQADEIATKKLDSIMLDNKKEEQITTKNND